MGNSEPTAPQASPLPRPPIGTHNVVLRIGGSTLSGAIGGAALASLGGPVATMIGCIVGGLAGAAVSTANVKADREGRR
jgi:outer membrane lipoprotein SlyB